MTTLTVTELFEDRDSESTLGGAGNEGVVNTYTRKFQVVAASIIGPQQARLAPGIPAVGDYYQTETESDRGALCHSVKASARNDTRLVWVVTCSYSNSSRDVGQLSKEISGAGDGQPGSGNKKSPDSRQQNDPESTEPRVTTDYRIVPKVLEVDLDGKHAMNSADEKFDPPIEYESLSPVIRITRLVRKHDFNDARNGVVTNTAAVRTRFGTAEAGTLLQVGIEVQEVVKNGETFIEETRTFFHDRDGWMIKKLDVGFREKHIGGGGEIIYKPILVKGDDGIERPVSSPVPLNGNGIAAAAGGGRAEVLTFRVYRDF